MKLEVAEMSPRDVYALMIDLIVPRPIALVSSLSSEGVRNLAPFSFFTGVSSRPPLLAISVSRKRSGADGRKDTSRNIAETKELVVAVTTEAIVERVVKASAEVGAEVDEFELSGLTPLASTHVSPPRVAESPVAFECRLFQSIDLSPGGELILAEILCVHVSDDLIDHHGRVDPRALKPVGRLGANLYAKLGDILAIDRPA